MICANQNLPTSSNTIQNFVAIHENRRSNDEREGRFLINPFRIIPLTRQIDWDRSADAEDVVAQFHDFHPNVVKIIRYLNWSRHRSSLTKSRKATNIKRWPLLYRDPVSALSKGRLVLIGDAAHPMLPR
jgi:salicylate hydroxylase